MDPSLVKERDLIVSQIKKYVPLFAPFLEVEDTVNEYSKKLGNFLAHPTHVARQSVVKSSLDKKFTELYGPDYEAGLKVDLNGQLMFNIVDHHQVLNHPFLISANVISSVDKFSKPERQAATIVISSGDVPPNNFFSKSGFRFHDTVVPLFSASEREACAYYLPKREFDFIDRLKRAGRWNAFSKEELSFLEDLQDRFIKMDFSSCRDYKDQISLIIKNTWPLMFEDKLRSTVPNLLYVTQEDLTSRCLIELLKKDNFISKCLFDKDFREIVLNNFRGIVVAWRENENKGTHFFWRKYPGSPRSLRMYIEGDSLVPTDPRFKHLAVTLDSATIIDMLEKGEIYPSLFLIFSVLNFYCGVKPLVGYGSAVYLEYFKRAWEKCMQEYGLNQEIELLRSVDLTGFVGGLPIFFKREDDRLKALYATDIFFEKGITEEYLHKISQMPFKDLLGLGLPEMYDYFSQKYVPEAEKFKPKVSIDDLAELALGNL